MGARDNEEQLLRSVALQNAKAVLLARERAEQESHDAKERVVNILESIRDGFFTLDQDWRFTYLNRRGEEVFAPLGKSRESLMGKSIWEEFPDAVDSDIERNYRRAVQEQETVSFETFFPPLNRWFEVRAYPGTGGLSVYFHDVTARRKSDEALRESEAGLRATFHQAAVGMALASLDGRFEQVNARFAEVLGFEPGELVGKTFKEITYPEDLAATLANVQKLLSGETDHYSQEKRYIRRNGEIVWSLTTVTILKDARGRAERFIGALEDITQRKRAEEALREGAQRLQLALSAGRLGDWSWDVGTDLVRLSPAAAATFGVPPNTSTTWKQLRNLLHPDDRKRAGKAVEEALENHSDYNIEYRIFRGTNTAWIAVNGSGVYDANGTVTGMIGVVQDITERKQTEELRSRLAAVVESSDDAIISMGLDTIITTWNKGAERMFGYTGAETIGRSITILIPKGNEDEEPKILQQLLKGERVDHYETIRARKDGTLLNVSLTVSPVYDASGKIIGVSKISRDITDRKRSEEALKEETRLLELLNSSGKAIASQLDLQRVVQTVTDSATEVTGAKFGAFFYNMTNASGESFLLYTLSGAPREAFEKFGHPRATPLFGPTFRGEDPVRCDDVLKDSRYGQVAPHFGMPKGHLPVRSYLAVPVISRTGEVIGGLFFGHPDVGVFTERSERLVVGMAAQAAIAIDNARLYDDAQREISQRKRVEEALRDAQSELRRHAERLEEQVEERTARLSETIQELEAFSYSVSHDMRSPLRAMQGYSDALLDEYNDKLDSIAQEYLNRIRRASSKMDLLIQDVLAYSRVAKGEIRLDEVSVESVIKDVIQNYPELEPGRADIQVDSPIPPVLGHEAYLTQIISNFLGNAVKFVPPGQKPQVRIYGTIEGDKVRVTFEDNGIGIAPEHQVQIFQIFGRVYSEKQYEGTGIGLAIARKAAERMGGSVEVQSELGKGSRFSFLLRRAK